MTSIQVRVTTGSRLHLGLLDTVEPFGGVGLMIDQPVTEVTAVRTSQYQRPNVASHRINAIAENFRTVAGQTELPPCQIHVHHQPKPHCGLGSGTQLSLAVAEAMCRLFDVDLSAEQIALTVARRGKRSAVGIHGYFNGGLVLEGTSNRVNNASINPIIDRTAIPASWCVGLFQESSSPCFVSGQLEQTHFDKLKPASKASQAKLRETATKQLFPAARASDFGRFAEAVEAYNHASGMLFSSVQGGAYNGPSITRLVDKLKQNGATGVGQSSWGPTVFAWFPSRQEATRFVDQTVDQTKIEVRYAAAKIEPRQIQVDR
ncbi:homoserine kinase [Novipirellula aureliae]|uniref:Homoserine kinase n=1 Tax=Novipirellula aureliae TaxID=2527966 RepID=A0A5C6DPV1_9BACT|nr:beta-ribofuranosylaminobenzene 5'-phosphate synthase [Novipirellula aureliae]TWU37681.1 homoserine kinase [Novipirellula aureliae]